MAIPFTRQFERHATAMQTGFVMMILLFVVAFIYILVLFSVKLLGVILFLGGLWLLLYFPWQMDYQRKAFMGSGRFLGLVLVTIGIILILYG